MAEEEVLTEQTTPGKRQGSGMSPMVILVVLILGLGILGGLMFMVMKGVKNIKVNATESKDIIPMSECGGKKLKVVDMSTDGKQLRLRLKDGYITTMIAICVDKKTPDTDITEARAPMMNVITEFFMGYTQNAIFPPAPGAAAATTPATAPPATNSLTAPKDEFGAEESTGGDNEGNTPQEKFRAIRQKLKDNLSNNFKDLNIKDVYMYQVETFPVEY